MKYDDGRWNEYVRLQRELSRSARVDDRTAGYEKALHELLTDTKPAFEHDHGIDIRKVCASAERRERHRRVVLLREAGTLQDLERAHADTCPHSALHARIELIRIVQKAKPKEIALLVHLAGADADIAASGLSPVAFRKRLERFRVRLAA